LSPNSPGTHQIDTLLWIGTVAAIILVVAINVALVYALRRYRADRGTEPREVTGGRGIQLRVGGALAAFAVIVFVLGAIYTTKAREAPTTGPEGLQSKEGGGETLAIKATGQQWLWRYQYPNDAFTYYKLVVPVDTAVALDLVTTDVIHTWDVPSLAGKADAVPGRQDHIMFRAEEEGTYRGQSATFSGQAYAPMRTEVEVVSPAEYEAFIKQTKSDIQAAQDRVVAELKEGK
jgi:cytochrome c oxidase subunit 2